MKTKWGESTHECCHCGDPIHQDEYGLWHHTVDDAVVCNLEPVQCASPRQIMYVSPEAWDELQVILARDPEPIPELVELFKRPRRIWSSLMDPRPPISPEFLDLVLRQLCPYCGERWVALHGQQQHPEKWDSAGGRYGEWKDWRDEYDWGPIRLRP